MPFKLLLPWQHLIQLPKFYYITKLSDKFDEKSYDMEALS